MNPFILVFLSIVFIIVITVRFKVHPVFSLFLAAAGTGLAAGLGADKVVGIISDGFGSTLSSIGFVIAFGTIIGLLRPGN